MAGWYVRRGDSVIGPADLAKLKELVAAGKLLRTDQLAKDAGGPWMEASRTPLFAPPSGANIMPPPLPIARSVIPPALPPEATIEPQRRSLPSPITTFHKALLGVGAAFLAVLAMSTFLTWVSMFGGGAMIGIEGDGKIILVLSVLVGAGLAVELAVSKRSVTSVFLAQGFGTIACLWMAGVVWRTLAIRELPNIRDNVFGRELASQITPGAGLIMGMLSAIGMAIVFALVAIQCLKKRYIFALTQTVSLLLGIGIASVAASSPLSGPSSPSDSTKPSASELPSIRLGQSLTLDQLKVTPQKVERVMVTDRSRSGAAKEPVLALTLSVENTSQGQVFQPYADASGTDNFGNELKESFPSSDSRGALMDAAMMLGSAMFHDLTPGQRAIVVLCLRPKIGTAASYRWEIMQQCSNGSDFRHWVLEFKAEEISDHAVTAPAGPAAPRPASPEAPAAGPTPVSNAPNGAAAGPSPKAPAPPATAEDGATGPPAIRLGQTLRLDQVKVTPQKVELKRVHSRDGKDEPQEPVLALTLLVENVSQGQVFRPYAGAKGKDSFGNELEEVGTTFTPFFPTGSAMYDDLKPGQQAVVILCLKPKIDTAASYRWEIWQQCSNSDSGPRKGLQDWALEFNAAEMGDRAEPVPAAPIPSNSANSDPRWRTWTTDGGKRTFDAKYLSAEGGTVKLEKADGTIIKIQIDELSNDDHKWIIGSPVNFLRTWTTDGGKRTFDAKYIGSEGGTILGTVKLEKADGTIIKIQTDDLSDDDQRWITRGGAPPPEPAPVAKPAAAAEPPAAPDTRLSRKEFATKVYGKKPDGVIGEVGTPTRTQAGTDGTSIWYYDGATYDPITGKTDGPVQVIFGHGVVTGVNFY